MRKVLTVLYCDGQSDFSLPKILQANTHTETVKYLGTQFCLNKKKRSPQISNSPPTSCLPNPALHNPIEEVPFPCAVAHIIQVQQSTSSPATGRVTRVASRRGRRNRDRRKDPIDVLLLNPHHTLTRTPLAQRRLERSGLFQFITRTHIQYGVLFSVPDGGVLRRGTDCEDNGDRRAETWLQATAFLIPSPTEEF